MGIATDFLLGAPDDRGRTVDTIIDADDEWLEYHHDWVQWAFPNQEPSAFSHRAPIWTPEEAASLPPPAVENLKRLLKRFRLFLKRTDDWRSPIDHNHARITRVLLCLRDAGLRHEAQAFYRLVTAAPEPGPNARSYWLDAINPPDAELD